MVERFRARWRGNLTAPRGRVEEPAVVTWGVAARPDLLRRPRPTSADQKRRTPVGRCLKLTRRATVDIHEGPLASAYCTVGWGGYPARRFTFGKNCRQVQDSSEFLPLQGMLDLVRWLRRRHRHRCLSQCHNRRRNRHSSIEISGPLGVARAEVLTRAQPIPPPVPPDVPCAARRPRGPPACRSRRCQGGRSSCAHSSRR